MEDNNVLLRLVDFNFQDTDLSYMQLLAVEPQTTCYPLVLRPALDCSKQGRFCALNLEFYGYVRLSFLDSEVSRLFVKTPRKDWQIAYL